MKNNHNYLFPIKLKSENIFRMNLDLDFKSNMIIIYGDNSIGKTLILKTLQTAFTPPRRPEKDPKIKEVIGIDPEGSIELIFRFQQKIFKITRKFTQENDYAGFFELNGEIEKINDKRPHIQKKLWKNLHNPQSPAKISKKINTRNYDDFQNLIKATGIHPEILDRLISFDNNQEFNQAVSAIGKGEGGYTHIKEILSKDLQEKQDALNDLIDNHGWQLKKLSSKKQDNLEKIKDLLEDLNKEMLDNKEIKEIYLPFQLNRNPDEIISQIESNHRNFIEELDKKRKKLDAVSIQFNKNHSNYDEITIFDDFETIIEIEKDFEKISINYDKLQIFHLEIKDIHSYWKTTKKSVKDVPGFLEIDALYAETALININDKLHLIAEEEENNFKNFSHNYKCIIDPLESILADMQELDSLLSQLGIKEKNISHSKSMWTDFNSQLDSPYILEGDEFPMVGKFKETPTGFELQSFIEMEQLSKMVKSYSTFRLSQFPLPYMQDKKDTNNDNKFEKFKQMVRIKIDQLDRCAEIIELRENQYKTQIESIKNIINVQTILIRNLANFKSKVHSHVIKYKAKLESFLSKLNPQEILTSKSNKQLLDILKSQKRSFRGQLQNFCSILKVDFRNDSSLKKLIELVESGIKREDNLAEQSNNIATNTYNHFLGKIKDTFKESCMFYYLADELVTKVLPVLNQIYENYQKFINIDEIAKMLMEGIISNAKLLYFKICKESFLDFDYNPNELYLKPLFKDEQGRLIPISSTGPSGSEQATLSLGILLTLAEKFQLLVAIDEAANNFGYKRKIHYYETIDGLSKNLFTIFVIQKTSQDEEEDLDQIKQHFSRAQIIKPQKNQEGKMTASTIYVSPITQGE